MKPTKRENRRIKVRKERAPLKKRRFMISWNAEKQLCKTQKEINTKMSENERNSECYKFLENSTVPTI